MMFNKILLNDTFPFREKLLFYLTLFLIFFSFFVSPFLTLNKFFDPYTTIKWIFVLFSINIFIFLFLLYSKYIVLPHLPKISLYLIGLIVLIMGINSYIHEVPLFSYENIRRLLFWGVSIFFLNFFYEQKEQGFVIIEKIISLSLTVFLCLAFYQYILHSHIPPYITFGNINLSAEFVGFSLVFPFGMVMRTWRESKKSPLLNLLIAATLAYLYFTFCRSITIAVAIMIIFSIYINKNSFQEIIKIISITALFIIIIYKITELLHPSLSIAAPAKSFSFRWLLYLDVIQMIMDNPLGVGLGQFEFASLPYLANLFPEHNETIIFLSPHNEFLHYLSEEGVILSILFFLLGTSVLFNFLKDIKLIFIRYPEFPLFSIVLFTQSLFQFPLIEPLPYCIIAMMLGYCFSLIKQDYVICKLTKSLRSTLLGGHFLVFIILTFYFSSEYISSNFPNNEALNKKACSSVSRNWYACLNVASSYIKKANYSQAEAYALRTLKWQPFNHQGIKTLGFISLYQGRREKACKLFEIYNSFFQNKTSLRQVINQECSDDFKMSATNLEKR